MVDFIKVEPNTNYTVLTGSSPNPSTVSKQQQKQCCAHIMHKMKMHKNYKCNSLQQQLTNLEMLTRINDFHKYWTQGDSCITDDVFIIPKSMS